MPLVSVLMTSYNREALIAESIESVLSSSFTDFELLIVDDASTDGTADIAKKYALSDTRVTVYVNKHNLGDYPNRNRAAELARGKYIKYVDSDDLIFSHGLEAMVESMEKFPQAGAGFSSLAERRGKALPICLEPRDAYTCHFFGEGLFHGGPLTAILRRDAFFGLGKFDEGRMISDTDMWYRIALNYPVVVLPSGLVWQRRHANQELSDQKKYIRFGERIKWKYLLDPKCKLTSFEIAKIRRTRLKRYAGFIMSGLKRGKFQQIRTYIDCYFFVKKIRINK